MLREQLGEPSSPPSSAGRTAPLALLVEEVVALEAREERVALGDTLPAGLRLVLDDNADRADNGE